MNASRADEAVARGWRIPLLRPQLPTAKQLSGYLERIDATRWYSNNGPLTRQLERRLAGHFGAPEGSVVCTCNGTLGLTLALMNLRRRPGDLCAMPAWTFAATPASAVAAGFVPWFVDVSERDWALDPEVVRAQLPYAPGNVRAAMIVAPFGAPLDLAAWRRFRADTGVDVVLDAAGGFDSLKVDEIPAMVSMDASKIFGIGQGAFVATTDESFAERLRRGRNFGFVDERISESPGLNAKISEYAAAIGLARLDHWAAHRAAYRNVTETYVDMLSQVSGVELQPSFGDGWYTSFLNVRIRGVDAKHVIAELAARGIEARKWWGDGCHRQPAFAGFPRGDLPVTQSLGASVVGLPFSPDLAPESIATVCRSLGEILGPARSERAARKS